jgi:hypothetical protein
MSGNVSRVAKKVRGYDFVGLTDEDFAKGHVQNWFDCIRSRAKPNADVEIGHRTATVCQLLVITRQLGRRLKWDPQKETFPEDREANALLDRPRRAGWELPQHT